MIQEPSGTRPRLSATHGMDPAGPGDGGHRSAPTPVAVARDPETAPGVDRRERMPIALLVDPEQLTRDLLRVVLARGGWQVIDAADPAGALSRLNGHRPALLVIDPAPPEAASVALAARIRSRDPAASIVVVSSRPEALELARTLAARLVPKPFHIGDFPMVDTETVLRGAIPDETADVGGDERAAIPELGLAAQSTAAALGAWRAAERRLQAAPAGSPERAGLAYEVTVCRAEYHRIVEAVERECEAAADW